MIQAGRMADLARIEPGKDEKKAATSQQWGCR
jgi:hypothetical protein